jgi:hypothetical protein
LDDLAAAAAVTNDVGELHSGLRSNAFASGIGVLEGRLALVIERPPPIYVL